MHKTDSTGVLLRALKAVAAGDIVITPALVGLAELAEHRDQLPTLTPRQREVLAARAGGEQFRSIARRMEITEKTAQEHWSVVTEKFARYLRAHAAADLERLLGLDPGILDVDGEDVELWWWHGFAFPASGSRAVRADPCRTAPLSLGDALPDAWRPSRLKVASS